MAGRRRSAIHDCGDLIEWHREDVVQDERESLRWAETFEHDQQCQTEGVGQFGLVIGSLFGRLLDERFRQPAAHIVGTAGAARAQHVDAYPAEHRGEPAAQFVDGIGIAARQPQPALLHRIFGLADRTQHVVSHRPQMSAVLVELAG